jgi:hypothetical protein
MIDEDLETQLHTIDLFVGNVLDDMKNVSKTTTKTDMLAYISAWQNELETVKYIIDI